MNKKQKAQMYMDTFNRCNNVMTSCKTEFQLSNGRKYCEMLIVKNAKKIDERFYANCNFPSILKKYSDLCWYVEHYRLSDRTIGIEQEEKRIGLI